jgi:hypothetical protein
MPGVKKYPRAYIDACRARVDADLGWGSRFRIAVHTACT